jgi:hypothetical protein
MWFVTGNRRAVVVLSAHQVAAKVPVAAPDYRVHECVGVGVEGQPCVVRAVRSGL